MDEVSILPLVERISGDRQGVTGEPGMSYLIRAGETKLLFDTGLSGGKTRSALVNNADALGVDLADVNIIVVSHLHADHVGGVTAMRHRTFRLAAGAVEPAGVPAHVPTSMRHPRADVTRRGVRR